jgi:hypothetical protein
MLAVLGAFKDELKEGYIVIGDISGRWFREKNNSLAQTNIDPKKEGGNPFAPDVNNNSDDVD